MTPAEIATVERTLTDSTATAADICQKTGLTHTTVYHALVRLEAQGRACLRPIKRTLYNSNRYGWEAA